MSSKSICNELVIEEIRNKLTVFGYVRTRVIFLIPVDVCKIIVTFYKLQDDWDKLLSNESIKINDDYIAENTNDLSTWVNAFGVHKIEHSIKEWTLRVFKIDSIIIGIVPSEMIHKQHNTGDYTSERSKLKGFGLCGSNGICYEPYDYVKGIEIKQVRTGDIVCMKLDTTSKGLLSHKGLLSYKVNDGPYKVAYRTVNYKTSWTLAVSLYAAGKVQLLK